jgi:hypothetical protein
MNLDKCFHGNCAVYGSLSLVRCKNIYLDLDMKRIGDMIFWLIRANKCTYYEKCNLNIFQNIKKIEGKIPVVHLNNLCSSTKVLWKKDIFCGMCKIIKNYHINSNFVAPKIVFFTQATKIIFFLWNLVGEHKMSRCTSRFFPKF